jgi:hypothetical protein
VASDNANLNDCGCCEGVSAQTPAAIDNRPGLSAIAYRIGTHPTFKQSLLAGLAGAPAPMRDLSTRDDDDFTIALLDAWAAVGDVLTFYQERIANENYLRTATERLSLFELARLIGYRPSAGIAAVAWLAFTVDGNAGSPQPAKIPIGVKVQSVPGVDETPQTFETIEEIDARAEWNALKLKTTTPQLCPFNTKEIWLDGASVNLKIGDVLLFVNNERRTNTESGKWDMRRVAGVFPDADNKRTKVTLNLGLTKVNAANATPVKPEVHVMRLRASLFGYNAPDPKLLTDAQRTLFGSAITGTDATMRWNYTIDTTGRVLFLDNAYATLLKDQWVLLVEPDNTMLYLISSVSESSQTAFAMSGKSSRVVVDTSTLLSTFAGVDYPQTMVFAQSEALPLLDEMPLAATAVTGNVDTLTLSASVTALPANRALIITGTLANGTPASEQIALESSTSNTLTFGANLANNYLLNSVVINANVAKATHGETVSEVLGSGDGARAYQAFTLKQKPVTHLSDAQAEGGAASTLALRVNDVLWESASTLYARGAKERIFSTRLNDDETTTVQFGDGVNGARLPTGAMNVRATYRKGLGAAGNVKAGQLSTLMTRPLGVTGAINPVAASGGEDAEQRDDARDNAPLTVLTLDRVVSLLDYENFARAFAGVKKALATWSWVGEQRAVFLTVAGTNGAAIAEDSDIYINLFDALRAKGDPFVPLRLKTYRNMPFAVVIKVKADPATVAADVRNAVKDALIEAFSFARRSFGQPVHASEIIAVAQDVAGVVACDVDGLVREDWQGGFGLKLPLPAALPSVDANGEMVAAELLTLKPEYVFVSEMV